MFHANAWGLAHAAVATGANLVMPGPDLSPTAIADLVVEERVTVAAGVPTIWMGVLPHLEGRDTSSLRAIPCGGSAVPKALSEAYRQQHRPADPAGLGHDRDEPDRVGLPRQVDAGRDRGRGGAGRRPRARSGRPWSASTFRVVEPGTEDPLPWDGETSGELQVRGPWIASQLLRRRAGRRVLHRRRLAAHGRRRHRRCRTATSASSTARRTSSSRAASGSARSSWRTS